MIKSAEWWPCSRWVAALLFLSVAAGSAPAISLGDAEVRQPATTAPARDETGGLVPTRLVWPGVVVIVVLAVIVTAALTGPIIKANTDDQDNDDSSFTTPSE